MKRFLCLFGVFVLVAGCSKEEVDNGAILSVSKDGEFSEITSLLGEGISYDDGGSMLYSSDEYDLSVLVCGTLDGNKDIYVGDYTMYYDNTMCK